MTKVRQLLRLSIVNEAAAAAITAIVGSRVYPSEIAAQPDPVYPCICFRIAAGPLDSVLDVYRGTMRVWCWSARETGTYEDAAALLDALKDYWHRTSFNDGVLDRTVALSMDRPAAEFFDPEVRAYACVSDWVLFASRLT